jgi:hypothetical protein
MYKGGIMQKLSVFLCLLVLTAGFVYAHTERNLCREDHQPPPAVEPGEKIGEIAGYHAFGDFVEEGGYGESQATLDQIEALNEAYQEDEFDPRQSEANDIYDWLDAKHEIDDGSETETCSICGEIHTMSEYESLRDAKVNRLNTLSGEIDDEWTALADTIRGMISDDSYEEFLAAH